MDYNNTHCIFCGGRLLFDGTEMAKNCFSDYDTDEEAIVTFAHCIECGRDYYIVDPTEKDREVLYKHYWKEGQI